MNAIIINLAVVGCIVLAFIISLGATPLSMIIARRVGAIDVPKDERRMHKRPTPRLGGAAIYLSFLICAFILRVQIERDFISGIIAEEMSDKLTAVMLGGTIIFLFGVLDDIKALRARYKLLAQIAAATVTFALGVRIPQIALFGWKFAEESAGEVLASYVITVAWIVIIVNMINLIDGLDGLAAGVSGIAALAIGYTAYINGYYTAAFAMAILAGAALGFLPFNFYPAKAFMGDCGAMFLGFAIATISIISPAKTSTIVAIIAPVLVLGVPAFDTLFAMIRRRLRGKSVFEADKEHLHHQLTRIGIGQRRSALILYGVSGVMGIAAIVFSRALYLEAVSLFLIAVLFIIVLIWGWDKREKP